MINKLNDDTWYGIKAYLTIVFLMAILAGISYSFGGWSMVINTSVVAVIFVVLGNLFVCTRIGQSLAYLVNNLSNRI